MLKTLALGAALEADAERTVARRAFGHGLETHQLLGRLDAHE